MHDFHYKSGKLFCEDVDVASLVAESGTPVYVYSQKTIVENIRRLETAMAPVDAMLCYAVKANSSLGILGLMTCLGTGFDVVSIGELRKVVAAGGCTGRCVFAGVGKSEAEIAEALQMGIYSFNVESEPELERINRIAGQLKKKAPVAVRVNPNVDAGTHSKITTGTYENKFGIPFESILPLYRRAKAKYKNLQLRGVQMHIGSQLTDVKPFVKAVKKMVPLVEELVAKYGIEFFSIGGGLGIAYRSALESGKSDWWENEGKNFICPEKFAKALIPLLQPLNVRILMEPGRFVLGNAGILVTKVEYVKQTGKKNFVVVDAGMNDLIRPALYDAYHQVIPLRAGRRGAKTVKADVVGPICESGDCFCHDCELPVVHEGDYLAVMSAGAYGFTMASNYNERPLPAEVLVSGESADYLRIRQTIETNWRYEGMPRWLVFDDVGEVECSCCCHGKRGKGTGKSKR